MENIVRDKDHKYVIEKIKYIDSSYIYKDIIDINIKYEIADILSDIIYDNFCPLINGIVYSLDIIHKLFKEFVKNVIKLRGIAGSTIMLCTNYLRNILEYIEELCLELQLYETLQNVKNFKEKNKINRE